MVLTDPERLVTKLRTLPAGARLLEVLEDVPATGVKGGRRTPRVEGPLASVFLVGGAVRDLALGTTPGELDLAVEGDAHAVADELRRRLGGRGKTHERFGTSSIEGRDGILIDVAATRRESYARPGALPDVEPASIADDLTRRDFSVNAIAVGVSPDRLGELHALPGALDDLSAGVLRVLHDASFADDPTRLLRLVRYAARLRFALDPATERLARAAFASGAPETAGVARMGNELRLLLAEERAVEALLLLRDLASDEPPSDGAAPRVADLAIDEPFLRRALALRPADVEQAGVLLAALCRRTDPKRVKGWIAGMHVPWRESAGVLDAVKDHEALAEAMRAATMPSALARAVRRRSPVAVVLAGAAGAEDEARAWLGDLRRVHLSISGSDLLEAGVRQGPELGRRLEAALDAKLDGEATSREDELAAALR